VGILKAIYLLIRAFLVSRLSLATEILALRQQVAVYKHTVKRPKMRTRDRVFWVWLSRLWSNWQSALPETVIQHHSVASCDHLEWFILTKVGLMEQFQPKSGCSRLGCARRRIFGVLRDASKNVCQIVCDRVLG